MAYRLVVLEPAKEALREFQASALSGLSTGKDQLQELTVNDVQISVLDSCRRSIVDEFNKSYYKALGELLDAANAWGDGRLTDRLTNLVTDLQDDVLASCTSTQNEGAQHQPPVDLVLRSYVSKLLSTLVHYEVDPPARRLTTAARWLGRKLRLTKD